MATEYRDDTGGASEPDDGIAIDPGTIDGTAPAEQPRTRKRRRDAGQPRAASGKTTKEAKTSLDLSSITGLFVGLHVLLAQAVDTPEIAITDDEGKQFLKAAQNVMRHYSVSTTQKTLDYMAFFGVAASIYAPRIAAVGFRRRAEKAAPVESGEVIPFPNGGNSGGAPHFQV